MTAPPRPSAAAPAPGFRPERSPGAAGAPGRPPALSLADLEAFDSRPAGGGRERRFGCPLEACRDKPRDRAHQSLSVNTETGAWTCYRCGAAGKLTERWQAAAAHRRALALRPFRLSPEPERGRADSAAQLPALWAATAALPGTPGAAYLAGRGLAAGDAVACGVRFARDGLGAPAVVFPLRDAGGELVAASGRYLVDRAAAGQPKTRTVGDLKLGAFATPGAWAADPLVLVEGPCDALALHAVGVPAVALMATRPPVWLTRKTFGRRVAVALDADAAGDAAAAALVEKLRALGATADRWRPPAAAGVKDWADAAKPTQGGLEALRGLVAARAVPRSTAPATDPVGQPAPVTLRGARIAWEAARAGTAEADLARRFYRLVRAAAIATDAGEDEDVGPYLDRVGAVAVDLAERVALVRGRRA